MSESLQIQKLRKLGLSEEEIQQVLADDKRIDKGEKLFELTAEQEKASKKARQFDRNKKPTVYKLDNEKGKRSKKSDDDKQFLIEAVMCGLADVAGIAGETVEVVNPEREIIFNFRDKKYKIVLSAPRS
jgi:hypothetical protein